MKEKEKEWCPTRGGTLRGWKPQYYSKKNKRWTIIPMGGLTSAFYPPVEGPILEAIDMLSYAQANCAAWGYSAYRESEYEKVKVRVKQYEIVYDIKAREV